MRYYLGTETKRMLVNANILSRLDYCNILLSGSCASLLDRLQRIINASVRFIFNLTSHQSVTEYTKQCHFLPVQ